MASRPRSLPELAAAAMPGRSSLCKCCGGPAPFFGAVDFNKNCEEERGIHLPPSGITVPYFRCQACGFLFTRFCDHWTDAEFLAHIYHGDYETVDPEFQTIRPDQWARGVRESNADHLGLLSVLDWGGGNSIYIVEDPATKAVCFAYSRGGVNCTAPK